MASFTREELEQMRRSEIRTLAVSEQFGMSPKEAVSAASKDLVDYILSKQSEGGKTGAKAGKKTSGKPAPEPAPEAEEAPPVEEAPEEAAPTSKTSKKEENAVTGRIDKLGLSLDDAEKNITTELGDLQQQVYVLMAMVKLMLGTTDLEPKDIDEAIETATEEFASQGK